MTNELVVSLAWVAVSKVIQHFCSYLGLYLSQNECSNAEYHCCLTLVFVISLLFLVRFRNGHHFRYMSYKKEGMIKKIISMQRLGRSVDWIWKESPLLPGATSSQLNKQDDGRVDGWTFP